MLVLKSVFLLFLVVEFAMGIGYVIEGEYYPIPANAELVLENPEVPIANSPLGDDEQMKRSARDPAWRHIGLGKKRSAPSKQRTFSMIGLGK